MALLQVFMQPTAVGGLVSSVVARCASQRLMTDDCDVTIMILCVHTSVFGELSSQNFVLQARGATRRTCFFESACVRQRGALVINDEGGRRS